MANPEHLEILKQGVEVWNNWWIEHPHETPDLSSANLSGRDLKRIKLKGATLFETNLSNTDLSEADFGPWEHELEPAAFVTTNLSQADLSGANLSRANLSHAYLSYANLRGADLSDVDLSTANLHDADLSGSILLGADLSLTDLEGAIFNEAEIGWGTIFAHNDLRNVKGLETLVHHFYSTIGIDTFYQSRGEIPVTFLRGCGVPEDFITYMRSLIVQPIQFYTCFISHSSKDQDFTERLHADLQNKGVRCWYAPKDIKIGDKFRARIDESIRIYDKLLLVLSENSVSSQWVEKEVETALEREGEQHKTILFPISLDDAVNEMKVGWPADVRRTRHIGDFTRWKDHDSYQKAFDRLLSDLKAGE